jgi:hypothetical protein
MEGAWVTPVERQQMVALRIQAAAFMASIDAMLGVSIGNSTENCASGQHPPDQVRRVGGGFGGGGGLNICGLCGETVN